MRTAANRFVPLLAGLALVMTGRALADDAPYAKLKALLPPGPDVKAILFIRYTTLSEEEAVIEALADGGTKKRYFDYDFTLAAKVRDTSETLYASGDCASAEAIGCGVDCDGGGVEVEPVAGGNDTVLVRLERIRMTLGCGEGASEVDLKAGEDDKVFKLAKGPVATCSAMQEKLDKGLE